MRTYGEGHFARYRRGFVSAPVCSQRAGGSSETDMDATEARTVGPFLFIRVHRFPLSGPRICVTRGCSRESLRLTSLAQDDTACHLPNLASAISLLSPVGISN